MARRHLRTSEPRTDSEARAAAFFGRSFEIPGIDIPFGKDLVKLLDVDREYRLKAATGTLRLIGPRRFNPSGEAWLPILHTRRAGREYTALYSNTAHARSLTAGNHPLGA